MTKHARTILVALSCLTSACQSSESISKSDMNQPMSEEVNGLALFDMGSDENGAKL